MRVGPIASPLPGEHLGATSPRMRPETDDARWRLRLNFWTGRSLTADALELEQENRAAHLAWRGRLPSAGIVTGLEVGLETPMIVASPLNPAGHFVHVLPGHAFMRDGEDVVVPRPLRVALDQIPVHYVRVSGYQDLGPAEAAPAAATPGVPRDAGGFAFTIDRFPDAHPFWAAVLLLCPADFRAFEGVDPGDPCELDPSRDAFADERRLDAFVLRLCQLPVAWETLPALTDRDHPQWRNRLAHVIFDEEARASAREQIRFIAAEPEGRRWSTVSRAANLFPWEVLGVPLALVSSELDTSRRFILPGPPSRRYFLDRASVVRPGGRARHRARTALRLATSDNDAALNPPGAGAPFTWRARVDQFAEHVGAFEARNEADIVALAQRFQFAPPAGFLPRPALTLLTTAQALSVPPLPSQPPDRAGVNHFFPASFAVEAVPVAVEDLDAALASSASLVPYDLASTAADAVRVLVPLPQRVFDPNVLVVEQEDPIFAATVARFVATQQDWRQRRDGVRARRNALQGLTQGAQSVEAIPPLDAGQLEAEPVETLDSFTAAGFTSALLSPPTTAPSTEGRVTFETSRPASANASLFVRLRIDQDAMPSRIEVGWRSGTREVAFSWNELPTPPAPPVDETGNPVPIPLWFTYSATVAQLGLTGATIDGFALRVPDGRVALASAGEITPDATGGPAVEDVWWRAQDVTEEPTFTGTDWTPISGQQLVSTFEDDYVADFPDGRLEGARIDDIDAALNPAGATARPVAMTVASHGLERALAELASEASEADDFIDTYFTRAQVNLYRIRKHVLGESAAQKLLINPAIAVIAAQETATATAGQLDTFIREARGRPVTAARVNQILSPPTITSITPTGGRAGATLTVTIAGRSLSGATAVTFSGTGVTGTIGARTPTSMTVTVTIAAGAALGARTVTVSAVDVVSEAFSSFAVNPALPAPPPGFGLFSFNALPLSFVEFRGTTRQNDLLAAGNLRIEALQNVFLQRPETGPTLPPRGLAIGQRFAEPPAIQNLSYARSALVQFLNQLPKLRLPLVGQTVRSISGQDVSLLQLQGRAIPSGADTPETLRTAALTLLMTVPEVTANTDEAEVTIAALDFTEVKSAILRNIERVTQQRRTLVQTGGETLRLLFAERDSASARILTIEGKLGEARHDVSVSRALRQEEQQRVNEVNDRRDRSIRDDVKFLAYVRPRTVDTVRRNASYWMLEQFGAPAPVPACLQRHDEPPPALDAYIQLLNHAPARWFPALQKLLARLDTNDKLTALLEATRISALAFSKFDSGKGVRGASDAVQLTVLSAHQAIGDIRKRSSVIQVTDKAALRWQDVRKDAEEHASIGDLVNGKHGSREVSSAAAREVEQIGAVATCLHAEFAAVSPAIRLAWIERFSQFDRPALLRDFTVLPHYGRLDRNARRRLQEFADFLFGQVNASQAEAVSLINDLVRLCLLLASHAPVNRIIAGHVPRPVPVRPGIQIPIRPLNPELVRVGMEFHVWQASRVVARGRVEDLQEGEVSARVETVAAQTTTLDSTMRVQFVAGGLSFRR